MKILQQALDSVLFHSQLCRPRECCGILMTQDDETSQVDLVFWGENTDADRPESRYELDHRSHIKAVEMECLGAARIVGYYHSHPDGASRPSRRDKGKAVDRVTYVIVGEEKGSVECTAWRFQAGEFVPEPLQVSEYIWR